MQQSGANEQSQYSIRQRPTQMRWIEDGGVEGDNLGFIWIPPATQSTVLCDKLEFP